MIIWGSKAKQTTGESGSFFCPSCKDDRRYTTIKWSRYFTLYFIPLFPTETLGTHVQCNSCRGDFKPAVLKYSKEDILQATSPWNCRSCNNLNPPADDACLACGKQRVEPSVIAA